jgi:hypothetical protein
MESVSPNSFRHAGALFFLVSCTKAYPCSGWPWPKEFHDHREKDRSQKNPLSLLLLEGDSSSLSLTVAEFCAEMRFVSHESLRVILLNSWLFHESSERFSFNSAIESYLSTSHRDSTTPICPFAAVGSELRLSGKETKAAATEVLERLIAALSAEAQGSESARRDAIAALSTMIGAVVLARIAGKTNLSSEILDAAKDYLHR